MLQLVILNISDQLNDLYDWLFKIALFYIMIHLSFYTFEVIKHKIHTWYMVHIFKIDYNTSKDNIQAFISTCTQTWDMCTRYFFADFEWRIFGLVQIKMNH